MIRGMHCFAVSASQGAAGALNSVSGSEVVRVLELSACGVSAVHAIVGRNFMLLELQLVLLNKLSVKR